MIFLSISKKEAKEIAELYHNNIYKFAFAKTRDRETALDLTQETFLCFIEKSPQLEKEKILSWLTCVCANKIKELFREQTEKQKTVSLDDIENICEPDPALDAVEEQGICFNEVQKRILSLLTPEEQSIFIELFINRTDIKIFAEENNISETAANARKSRLKKKAKSLYRNTYFFVLVISFKFFC